MGIVIHFLAGNGAGSGSRTRHRELKRAGLEQVLGPVNGHVCDAPVPYDLGGFLDLYLFPQATGGTAFATMELIGADSAAGGYELLAFTRKEVTTPELTPEFKAIERRTQELFTDVQRNSPQILSHHAHVVEIPSADNGPNRCAIFEEYAQAGNPFLIGNQQQALLLCTEVHPSELSYADRYGADALIWRLRKAGHYPWCDMDRPSVA